MWCPLARVLVCASLLVLCVCRESRDVLAQQAAHSHGILHAKAEAARISVPPLDQQVRSGGQTMLTCEAEGEPQPQISWLKDGVKLKGPRYSVDNYSASGSVLWIWETLAGRDDGQYACMADSGVATPAANASFSITVYPEGTEPANFPRIKPLNSSHLVVDIGSWVEIACQAEGSAHITWVRDLKPLERRDDASYQQLSNGSLQLRSCRPEDEGVYRCVARSDVGALAVSQATQLSVSGPPTFSRAPLELLQVDPGSPLKLTCAANGWPRPLVQWRLENGTDATPPWPRQVVLKLEHVRHAVRYTCIASNEHGTVQATTVVSVNVATMVSVNATTQADASDPKSPPKVNVKPSGNRTPKTLKSNSSSHSAVSAATVLLCLALAVMHSVT